MDDNYDEEQLFDDLNNESSELYKKNLIKTNCYIEKLNLGSSKRKIFRSYAKISGSIDDILTNIINGSVFRKFRFIL